MASDFTFIDNHKQERYMSDTEAPYIVLFFYNPDCDHCKQFLKQLKKDKLLSTYARSGSLAVIAVAVQTDEEGFMSNFYDMPIEWNKGYCDDCEDIIDHYLMEVPAIFVLDDIKTIIQSDIKPKDLENFIKTINPSEQQ
jgi:thioredoxin-related protein